MDLESNYVKFRQYVTPRRAPRLFYTLELSSAIALGWWVDHWPWTSGTWVWFALLLGTWLGLRSEWPVRGRGLIKHGLFNGIMRGLAVFAGVELAREVRHHHQDGLGPHD